jgi:cytochrome b561
MSLIETSPTADAIDRETRERSGASAPLPAAKILHWTVAVLVFGMFSSGVMMTQIGFTPFGSLLFAAHKLCGVGALVLLVARLTYRIQAHLRGRWSAEIGGQSVHHWLYALAILVPLLGWAGVSDFGARTTLFGIVLPQIWPEGAGYDAWLLSAHAWLAFGLIALVMVHIAVALQNYVMRGSAGKDRTVD